MSWHERFPSLPRVVIALMTAALFAVVGSSYATAQTSEPLSSGTLTAPGTSDGVTVGEAVQVSGSGFAPGSNVSITLESTPVLLRTVTTDGAGAFSTTVEIPRGTTPGRHTLKATGANPAGGLRVLTLEVNVTAPAGPQTQPQPQPGALLPRSGSNAIGLVAVGLAIMMAGCVVLAARWRRAHIR